jgi:predicted 3-demethylubiquinone-9 3-methyltransferase (glyoxalase superfamily)
MAISADLYSGSMSPFPSWPIVRHKKKEIDYYREKLSAVSEAEQCGWLKDKYGLS